MDIANHWSYCEINCSGLIEKKNYSMDEHVLRTFVAVCERQSFRAAGEDVGRTQSAVSQQIKGLEAELGVQLFNRSTRSVEMTPAGQTFYSHACSLLARHREAVSAARGASVLPYLRIGATDDIAAYGLVPVLRALEAGPEPCSLDLETHSSQMLLASLGSRYDLAIVVSPQRGRTGDLVASVPLVWLGSASLSTSQNALPLAVYADRCAMRDAAISALDTSAVKWTTKATVSGLIVIEAAVRAGIAVAPALAGFHAADLPTVTSLPALPHLELRIVAGTPVGETYLPYVREGLQGLLEAKG
ncbi:HTH-type transcriptional regulator BenM [Labrenzia sp. THAF191b]|nr:HTH-type transcriptional regulator BenM [Labrenzia sp. THAF191b]QFT03236.1 HTH-type transcriptional regulator BenM [Labrenzia sp. THAF191a]QFT14778.1 HTH-type transcriptional regulator BenM [Labrenzia sp. THAF187b]